jgi:hypothetical protein
MRSILSDQRMQAILIKISFLDLLELSAVCIVLGSMAAGAGSRNRHPAFKRRLLGYVSLLTFISTAMFVRRRRHSNACICYSALSHDCIVW